MNQTEMLLKELNGLKKAIRSPAFPKIINKAFIPTGFLLFWRCRTLFTLNLHAARGMRLKEVK